jgi:excisionase family DNA binding protein
VIPELLTVAEVAKRLRCSVQHVRQICKSGKVEAFRDGKQILISAESLERYLDERHLHGGPRLGSAKRK